MRLLISGSKVRALVRPPLKQSVTQNSAPAEIPAKFAGGSFRGRFSHPPLGPSLASAFVAAPAYVDLEDDPSRRGLVNRPSGADAKAVAQTIARL